MKRIKKDKRVFLHRQFLELLKKEIKEGKYKPGEYIPSERELVERYSLSRSTVRRAISQLISEGWLYSVPGTGTFVSEVVFKKEEKPKTISKNIACILKVAHSPLDSPYYSKIFSSMQEEIARRGYHLSFYSFIEESKLNLFKIIRERNLDGVIFVGGMKSKIILDIHKNNFPMVVVDNYLNKKDITTIVPDNKKGALEATRYLIKLGHRKIYFLGANPSDVVVKERLTGFKEALEEANISYKNEFFIESHYQVQDAYQSMKTLLKERKIPTAILTINDEAAIGVIKAIKEKSKLKVPQDISVIGFDDIDWAAHTNPPLTTVRIQKEKTGTLAVKFLIDKIESKDFIDVKIVTPVELIVRSSCTKPSK